MSLNKVMLIGNVGRDPEVRYLDPNAPTGRKVATFTLATSEKYKDRNGEMRENTEWHNIVVWGNSADVVEKYVKKGTQLYIEGRIRTRSWTDQSGAKKYTTEINVDSLQLLGRRDSADGGFQAPNAGYANPSSGYSNPSAGYSNPTAGFPSPSAGYQSPVQEPVKPVVTATAPEESDDLPF